MPRFKYIGFRKKRAARKAYGTILSLGTVIGLPGTKEFPCIYSVPEKTLQKIGKKFEFEVISFEQTQEQ